MNKNMMIFIIGSIAMILGWQWAMNKYYPTPPVSDSQALDAKGNPVSGTAASPLAPAAAPMTNGSAVPPVMAKAAAGSIKPSPEQLVTVETTAYKAVLSTLGARFDSLQLKGVTAHNDKGEPQTLDLIPSGDLPHFATVQLPGVDLGALSWTLLTKQPLMENGQPVVRFAARVPGLPLDLVKTFSFDAEKPQFNVRVSLKNNSAQLMNLQPFSLQWGPNLGGENDGAKNHGRSYVQVAGVVQLERSVERERANNDESSLDYSDPRWVALKNHYFVAGFFPVSAAWNKAQIKHLGKSNIETALVADGLSLAPGKAVDLDVLVYAGVQEYSTLKAFGKNFQAVVQFESYKWFEWLNPLCIVLLYIMRWFHTITGNWGVAIILLTLLVRAVMFYPSMKSMVSMRKMQTKMAAMQPRLDTIKKIYKDDAQKLNAEMMKLYKEYGVNPLGGCLPMLLQIPIFFSLYGTLNAAYELRGAAFLWRWTDLTAGDPTYIFPLAMGISMFLQQRMTPTNTSTMSDEQAQMQKMMLWMMPIMFTGMAIYLQWPMGLLLYWTASNSFGVAQQFAVNKAIK